MIVGAPTLNDDVDRSLGTFPHPPSNQDDEFWGVACRRESVRTNTSSNKRSRNAVLAAFGTVAHPSGFTAVEDEYTSTRMSSCSNAVHMFPLSSNVDTTSKGSAVSICFCEHEVPSRTHLRQSLPFGPSLTEQPQESQFGGSMPTSVCNVVAKLTLLPSNRSISVQTPPLAPSTSFAPLTSLRLREHMTEW